MPNEIKSAWIGIAGVAIGLVLGEVLAAFRRFLEKRRYLRAIENELQTNLKIIGDKIDIVRKIQAALASKLILPGQGVHILSTAYDSYFGLVYDKLTPTQRENLNIIYGQLKTADSLLDDFERNIMHMIQFARQVFEMNPFEAFRAKFHDLEENYNAVGGLITKYLAGVPENVHSRPWQAPATLKTKPDPKAVDKLTTGCCSQGALSP